MIRDQHGQPLPGSGTGDDGGARLGADQVDQALGGLPGWERRGTALCRGIAVESASAAGLREGVLHAAGPDVAVALHDAGDRIVIVVGAEHGELTVAEVEAAARVDAVLSGSAGDHGSI